MSVPGGGNGEAASKAGDRRDRGPARRRSPGPSPASRRAPPVVRGRFCPAAGGGEPSAPRTVSARLVPRSPVPFSRSPLPCPPLTTRRDDGCPDLWFPGLRHPSWCSRPVQEPHPPGQGPHPERLVPGPEDAPRVGGCAGNIAYNLKLLGGDRCRWPRSGRTSRPIARTWRGWASPTTCACWRNSSPPQCFITTDHDNNQITAFHPGAMGDSHPTTCARSRASPSASSRRTAARACCRTRGIRRARHSVHLRPGPGDAAVQQRGVPRLHRAGGLRDRQRLRIEPAAGTHGLERAPDRLPREGVHRDPRPRGADIFHDGISINVPPAREGKRWWIPPVAATFRAGLIYGLERARTGRPSAASAT